MIKEVIQNTKNEKNKINIDINKLNYIIYI